MTCDHKSSDPAEQRRVKEAGGFISDNRISGLLQPSRALGDADMKEFASGNPYTSEVNLDRERDKFLVVACDGLWDVVCDEYCCQFIHSKLAKGVTNPDVIAESLVDLAMNNGSRDNISVVVVIFNFKKEQCEEIAKSTGHDDVNHESNKDEKDEDSDKEDDSQSSEASENDGNRKKMKKGT